MRLRLALSAALALAAAGCATVPRLSAANDIRAFLVAVRDGDRAGFDAHVDRAALKTQLRSRILGETARAHGTQSWATLGAALAGPLVDVGVDALVQPEVFRAEAVRLGYDPDQPIPPALALAPYVRPLGDGRVCVITAQGGPCVFDFDNEAGAWRLTGYDGPLRLPPPARR
ncbi:MAG: DUF2939 domain-containing protein [Caulobacteraceae bacterium]|nr:DUF2939 domain-containing protein [Caulobacter sp.]